MFNEKLLLSRRYFLTLSIFGLIPACHFHNHAIREMQGQVKVNARVATLGTSIGPGDIVATGKQSKVFFILGEDAYSLGEESVLQLATSVKTGGFWLRNSYAEDTVQFLRLLQGTVIAVFGKGEKKIVAPTAAIGIRGTGLCLHIGLEQTYFCTCYGETDIITMAGQQHVQATHHKAYSISHDAIPVITAEGKKYHEDEDMHYLESLVGRQTPPGFR